MLIACCGELQFVFKFVKDVGLVYIVLIRAKLCFVLVVADISCCHQRYWGEAMLVHVYTYFAPRGREHGAVVVLLKYRKTEAFWARWNGHMCTHAVQLRLVDAWR